MNAQRDPDAILAAWLEEGPTRLPEQTRRAIEVNTRTTEQKRRSLWAPWRTPLMTPFARVAIAAIAVIAFAGGAVYFFRPNQGVGVAPPTPSPIATAVPSAPSPSDPPATVPVDWTTYTSSRFAYTIDYPADWLVTPATLDWPPVDFPDKEGQELDVFGPRSFGTQLLISSVPLRGKVAAEWLSALDAWNASHLCNVSTTRTLMIDGVSAREQENSCMAGDQIIEVVMANDKRFYQINMFGTPSGPFTDADRATFDQVLASFHFGA